MQMTVYPPNGSGAFQLSGVYIFVSLAAANAWKNKTHKNIDPMKRIHGIKT